MTLRHIRIFEAVCDCGCNMTRAAESLRMTQPAVSLAVSELESYYGVRLFDRIARRLYLTEAGRAFLDYARRITLTFDDMERTVRDWEERGRVRVGASVSIGAKLMPSYAADFREKWPGTEVRVRIDRSDKLEAALAENELDFALIEGIVHNPDLVSEDYLADHGGLPSWRLPNAFCVIPSASFLTAMSFSDGHVVSGGCAGGLPVWPSLGGRVSFPALRRVCAG